MLLGVAEVEVEVEVEVEAEVEVELEVELEVEAEAEAVGEAGHKRGKDYVGYKELNFLLLELYVLLIGGNLEGYLHMM